MDGVLPGSPAPGARSELRLVMTKFGTPDVRAAYRIRLGPA